MEKGIRIAFVMPHLKSGGIEHCRIKLMEYFVSIGLTTDLVVARMEGELVESIPSGVDIYEVGKGGSIAFFVGMLNYIRRNEPSCMLTGHEDVNCLVIFANYISRGSSATILSNHSIYSKVISSSSGCARIKNFMILLFMRWAYKRADSIVAVTEAVAKDLAKSTGYPLSKIEVVNNPVIIGGAGPGKERGSSYSKEDASLFVVTFVGRLHPVKNVDVLIEAIARIRDFSGLRLKIVGDGPCAPYLRGLVKSLSIESIVEFSGYVRNPISFIAASDLLVLPSEHEASGNVLVEAMSCGVQLVATAGDHGPAEILEGGKLGQLVAPGSIDEMVEAIMNAATRRFWVEQSLLFRKAKEFTVESSAGRYLAIIGSVVV